MTDYAKEYDNLVGEFNKWARSVSGQSDTTIDRIFDYISLFNKDYSNLELTVKQKDAVVNGAECMRNLEKIKHVSEEDQPYVRYHLESTYMVHRVVYMCEAEDS